MLSYFPFLCQKTEAKYFMLSTRHIKPIPTILFILLMNLIHISQCVCVWWIVWYYVMVIPSIPKKVSWWFYPPFLYFLIDDSSTWNKLFRLKWFQKTMNPSNHFMLPMRETTTYRKKNVVGLEKVENFTCVIFIPATAAVKFDIKNLLKMFSNRCTPYTTISEVNEIKQAV